MKLLLPNPKSLSCLQLSSRRDHLMKVSSCNSDKWRDTRQRWVVFFYATLIVLFAIDGAAIAQTRQFIITNNCAEAVWVAGAGNPTPVFNGSSGGLGLAAGATVTTSLPTPWVGGRFWGRRQCTFDANGKGSCQTGDLRWSTVSTRRSRYNQSCGVYPYRFNDRSRQL